MNIRVKQYSVWVMLSALLMLPLAFTGCSEYNPFEFDDNGKNAINSPSLSESNKTVSQLSFAWDAVEGASQYAYELRDPLDELVSGNVTTETTATFTGLKDNTTYTLNVWAFTALNSDKKGSPVATLKATTAKIVPLEAPVPTATTESGQVVITWEAIEHADSYAYSVYQLANDDETLLKEGTVTENVIKIGGLEIGSYRLYLYALSDDEAYSQSEVVKFDFERSKVEKWRQTGSYASVSGETFTADIVAYDDGSYAIDRPYGEEGYKIEFNVDAETSEIAILNGAYSGGWYIMWVSSQRAVSIYPSDGYSSFSGNKAGGEVWFYTYCYDANVDELGSGYDWFTWGNPGEDATWSAEGEFALGTDTWKATLTANEDGTYTIKHWMGAEGYDMHFSVDDNGGMTILDVEGDDYYWYVQGDASNWYYLYKPDSDGVYAIFEGDKSGGQLSFYEYYYGQFTFTWGAAESQPQPWEATGSFVMEDYEDQPWGATISYNEDGTYTIKDWYNPGEDLNFTVDEEGSVTFINCQEDEYYWYVPMGGDYGYVYKPIDGVSYATFEGDEHGGTFQFYEYYSKYITFTWGTTATAATAKKKLAARPAPKKR
ncbi:MAG: hypothetical protein ACI38V_10700 [Bacteroides sp.]